MDLEAFSRGDMQVLGEAVERFAPELWLLARRGFVVHRKTPAWVLGIDRPSEVEARVIAILTRAFTPARRKEVQDEAALRRLVLEEARKDLLGEAERRGRTVSTITEAERAQVPPGVEDVDDFAEGKKPLGIVDPPLDAGQLERAKIGTDAAARAIEALDAQNRTLIELRFREGKDALETAHALTCGRDAVRSKERRVRRRVFNAVRRAMNMEKPGPAEVDAYLAGTADRLLAPRITFERIKKEVLKRTFQEEPRPYGQRLAIGLVAAALAAGLWLLMYTGVLPYSGGDSRALPRVLAECAADCRLRVRAPRGVRYVAIAWVEAGGRARPAVVDPGGRSIALPFGAEAALVPLSHTAPRPEAGLGRFVALFSKHRLTKAQIAGMAEGKQLLPKVVTASAAVALE